MKCEEVSNELMAYIDGRANTGATRRIEEHLATCTACAARAEEFRKLWAVLDEAPAIQPSLGFDARLRQRIATEPVRPRFFSFVRQPRLALSMALLAVLAIMVAKLPLRNPVAQPVSAMVQQEDFNAIRNLGVLENYDVVTKLGALSDLTPMPVDDVQPPLGQPNLQQGSNGGNGGA